MADLSSTIKDVQRALGIAADGIAGALTWAAIAKAVGAKIEEPDAAASEEPALAKVEVDSRSAGNIATLSPIVQVLAIKLLRLCHSKGIDARIISGTRTYEEQTALYEQGRTKPGKIVTNARAGYSWHNFSVAFDIGIFQSGNYLDESPLYDAVGKMGKEELGLEWGGDWQFQDKPHFQWNPHKLTLADARKLRDEGGVIA